MEDNNLIPPCPVSNVFNNKPKNENSKLLVPESPQTDVDFEDDSFDYLVQDDSEGLNKNTELVGFYARDNVDETICHLDEEAFLLQAAVATELDWKDEGFT